MCLLCTATRARALPCSRLGAEAGRIGIGEGREEGGGREGGGGSATSPVSGSTPAAAAS